MWLRTAKISTTSDAVRIRHEAVSGPECRLLAALLRWDAPSGDAPGAALVGAAWEGPTGSVFWGWPDGAGQIQLRPGSGRPEVCSLLPPALSLALAFRRSGVDLGVRALVIGDGFLSRIARVVALTVGCRILEEAGRNEGVTYPETRPDIVIETTGEPRNLGWATERCAAWGRLYSLGGALNSGPLNYYTHVHCRALTVTQVPDRPVLLAGEEEITERCAARLAETLMGITPEQDEGLEAVVLPEGMRGRIARERSGWSLLRVEDA